MSLITERSHRLGNSNECPDCGYATPSHYDWLREMREAKNTGDPDKVTVFSVCPMCGSRSWAHYKQETLDLLKKHPDYIDGVAPALGG